MTTAAQFVPAKRRPGRPRKGEVRAADLIRPARTEAVEPIDIHLGTRLRHARVLRSWSRRQLAEELGVSHTQLEKFESGYNRMFANRIWAFAQALDLHPGWFFDGFAGGAPSSHGTVPDTGISGLTAAHEDLIRLWDRLGPAQQRLIRQTAAQLAGSATRNSEEIDAEGESAPVA